MTAPLPPQPPDIDGLAPEDLSPEELHEEVAEALYDYVSGDFTIAEANEAADAVMRILKRILDVANEKPLDLLDVIEEGDVPSRSDAEFRRHFREVTAEVRERAGVVMP